MCVSVNVIHIAVHLPLKHSRLPCRYLEEALGGGSGLRQQDVSLAFKAVARSEVGTFVAWHFLRENWRELSQL